MGRLLSSVEAAFSAVSHMGMSKADGCVQMAYARPVGYSTQRIFVSIY